MYQVSSVSYMHIHVPFITQVVCCCFPRNDILLNMTFIVSHSSICLPSFNAAVSEIRELNRKEKKKNSEVDYFQFKTFPGHINHFSTKGTF